MWTREHSAFRPVCRGCGEEITAGGDVVLVTVTAAQHVISVPSHDRHRAAARAAALEDRSWQAGRSHYAGPLPQGGNREGEQERR